MRKLTTELFKDKLRNKFNNEYELIDEYINTHTKVLFRHNSDYCNNHEFMLAPNKIISSGRLCPICSKHEKIKKITKSEEQFKKELSIVNPNYTLLGKYMGNDRKTLFRHESEYCGFYEWETTPGILLSKKGCPVCSKKIINKYSFENNFYSKFNKKEFILFSDFISRSKKVKVKHLKCDTIFECRPDYIRILKPNELLCPICDGKSIGENKIRKYLESINIKFEMEKSFKDCKYKLPLKFDFVIYNEDNTISIIEFDGKQHFKEINFMGGKEGYEIRKKRDSIKNEYCKNKNIDMLRISYKEISKIEEKINLFLNRS